MRNICTIHIPILDCDRQIRLTISLAGARCFVFSAGIPSTTPHRTDHDTRRERLSRTHLWALIATQLYIQGNVTTASRYLTDVVRCRRHLVAPCCCALRASCCRDHHVCFFVGPRRIPARESLRLANTTENVTRVIAERVRLPLL